MNGEQQDQARELAERIARRLAAHEREGGASRPGDPAADSGAGDITTLRAGLADIQRRLAHIESHLGHDESCAPEHGAAAPPRADDSRQQVSTRASSPAVAVDASRAPRLSSTYVPATTTTPHPSQERFGIDEAVSEIVDFFEREKVCSVEPGGKPCDHCSMCSSRGF